MKEREKEKKRERERERNTAQLRASWKTFYRIFIASTGTLAKRGLQTEFACSIEQKRPVVIELLFKLWPVLQPVHSGSAGG